MTTPVCVCEVAVILAIPKSVILTTPVVQKHDVGRFDIPVDDPFLMRIIQGIGDIRHITDDLAHGQQVILFGVFFEIFAFQILHGDICQVLLITGIVDGDDVGMGKGARAFGLPEKLFFHLFDFRRIDVVGKTERLDRSGTVDPRILAEINDAHGAFAELFGNFVSAECRPGTGGSGQQTVIGRSAAEETVAENHGFADLEQLGLSINDILEFGVVIFDVFEHRRGLVQLPFSLVIQGKRCRGHLSSPYPPAPV